MATQKGGAEKSLVNLLILNKKERAFEAVVIFFEDGPLVTFFRENALADVRIIKTGRLSNILAFLRAISEIRAVILAENIEIILSWMTKAQIYGSIAALLTSKQSIWFQHGFSSRKSLLEIFAAYLPAKGLFTCSEYGKKIQNQLFPKKNIFVQYEFICYDEILRTSSLDILMMKKKLGLPSDRQIIGFVGRLQKWKGVHFLLKAMPEIIRRNPKAICIIVGGIHAHEQGYELELRQLVEDLKIQKNTFFCGQQQNALEWMMTMDVFVHSSDNEPLGMVILESMALGIPTICSPNGGPSEIVTNNINGILCQPDQTEILTKNILLLLKNSNKKNRMTNSARKFVQDYVVKNTAMNFANKINYLMKK